MKDLAFTVQGQAHTTFDLDFAANQSYFVVFRKGSKAGHVSPHSLSLKPLLQLTGSWKDSFDPRWGGPGSLDFASLDDWTHRPEKGVKYYSGTARYNKVVSLPVVDRHKKIWLDLGQIKYIAIVRVNGKEVGVYGPLLGVSTSH